MSIQKKNFKIKIKKQTLQVSAAIRKSGPEWILCLHGIQSGKSLFEGLFKLPALKPYSMLALDFVGFGNSGHPKDFSYDLKDQAEVCKKIIETLKIRKLHIIGHSLGGMVGTLLLRLFKKILISFINMEGNLVAQDCGASAAVASMPFETFQQMTKAWKKQASDDVFYKTALSIVRWSKSEKLFKLFLESPVKKLFMFGSKNAWKTSILPGNIPLAKISRSGHFMLRDNPKETYKKISHFLRLVEPTGFEPASTGCRAELL